MPYYLEKPQEIKRSGNGLKPSFYSVSLLPNEKAVNKVQRHSGQRDKQVVKGYIKEKYGFCQIDKNHIDLWLYENATPWIDFTKEE